MKAAPTMAVKELNKRALTRYLYANGPATKQVLERELGLSLPTITQNLRALEQEGLVGKGEQLESTGGRKAQTFVFKSRFKAAIGVSMRSNSLNLCAIDLHGGVIAEDVDDVAEALEGEKRDADGKMHVQHRQRNAGDEGQVRRQKIVILEKAQQPQIQQHTLRHEPPGQLVPAAVFFHQQAVGIVDEDGQHHDGDIHRLPQP